MSTRKYRKKNNRKTRKKIQGDPNTFLKNLKDVKKVQHSLLRRRSRKRIKMRGGNNNDGSSKIKKREELYEKRNSIFKNWLITKDHNNISNQLKIEYLIDNLTNLIKNKGYIIQFEKEFKNEIASLIYNNSN